MNIIYKGISRKEAYFGLPTQEKEKVALLINGFTQELLTYHGSSFFDVEYGTVLMENLSGLINIEKVSYYIKQEALKIKDKYSIMDVEILSIDKSSPDELNVSIIVHFDKMEVPIILGVPHDGNITNSVIMEVI